MQQQTSSPQADQCAATQEVQQIRTSVAALCQSTPPAFSGSEDLIYTLTHSAK